MADKNFSSKGSFRKLQNELKKSFEETIKKASTEAFDDVEIEGEVDGKKVKVKGSAIKNEVQKQLEKNLEEVTISPTVNIEPEFKMAKGADKKVENLVKDISSNTVIAPKVDLSKAINSFEDLKAVVSEFEEVYNRIQKGTLRRQDPKYLGTYIRFGDFISGDDYRDTVDWDIKDEGLLDKQKEKLLEIYKLYKNIQSAIKNNKGFYKGEQYDTRDLEDLEKVFKSYAQAYYEMSLEIQDADKRITEELAMDGFTSKMSDEVESLESVTSKMTKQFKGYVQEVIENSDAVRKNNTAYKEEQQQLQESNALLKERAQLLRDKILDTVKNKRGEDAYDKARYALPYLYDDYDMYDDWGVDSWKDEKIDVLKEVAEALGVEIPQAAEKAKESLKEISQTEDVSDIATPISEELEKENSKAEEVLETFKKIKAYLDGIESDEHSDLYGFQDLKGKDFNAVFNAFKNFDFDLLKEIGFSEEEINESRVAFERVIAEVKETQSLGRKVKNQDKWDAYESEFGQPPEVRVIDLADDWLNVIDKLINKIQELGSTENSSEVTDEVKGETQAHRDNANAIEQETQAQEENTKAARKRLTEQARYYLNKATEGKIDYSETEAQFNRIISEMQQLGESTAHVEEQFAKAKAAFNMDGVAEEAEKGAEKIEKEAESFSENAEKAQEAAQAKGKFNEANKETQQEADKSTDKVKEEAEAVDEATLAFDGYYKNQRNKVGDDSWGYTERVGYAQDLIRNISHDDQGNLLVSESLRTNYEKLEKEVLKVDKAMINLKSAMADMSRQGIDTTESQDNLTRLELYLLELEDEMNKYYTSAEYMPSTNQQQIFANVRKEAAAFEESRLKQKEYVRQFRETESARKKAESLDTSKAIKLDAWDKLADKISNDTHLLAVFGQKMNNVGDSIMNATNTNELRLASAALQQLTSDVNEEVSALKKMESEQDSLSSDLYGQMADKVKEIYTLREKNVSLDKTSQKGSTELAQNEARINELLQETVALRQRINNESVQQVSQDQEIAELARKMNSSLADATQVYLGGQIDTVEKGLKNYSKKISEVIDSPKFTDDFRQRFRELDSSLQLVADDLDRIKTQGVGAFDPTEVEALRVAFDNLGNSVDEALGGKKLSENKAAAASSLAKLRKSIEDIEARNSAMGRSFREQFDNLKLEIDTAKSNERVEQLKAEIVNLEAELIRSGKIGKSAFQQLREAIGTANTQFLMRYFSLQDWIRYGRQAITTIEELDYALVDLKKTSSMTSSELKDFYFNANDVAKRMGVTTKAIIEQASSWSRLGYSTKEASTQMAELSSQFASISPGMSTEDAQIGLVSLMKAYEVSTDEVERKLMDNINVLGNKFAETNNDIIEGMKRAGATLSAIGTSAEDSFALFTGAQEIIQNAETVGTALKTLSLRIRGFDEETEEMSDDVIAAVGKVASLTKVASNGYAGVSLWADAAQTQYRSLKDYLGDIAEIWDEIDAKSQTDLLNNLFGKRGASVGSSILKNFSQVEKALEEMENAAGAADAEMTIIQESIDYKLNDLRQTWVGILQQLIDNGMLGELIDSLTSISEAIGSVVTSIGPLPTLIGGIGLIELITHLDKVSDFFRTTKIVDQIKALYGLTLGAKWISPTALTTSEFMTAMSKGLYNADLGLVRVQQDTSALNASFLKLIKAPLFPWLAGATAALIAIGVAIYKTKQANDELRKSAKELGNQYKESKDELSDYKTQIQQLYETINDENVSYEESKSAREKLLSIQDQLIEKYGKEYESINLITDAINGEVDALDRLTDKQWTEAMNQFNEQNLKGWDWMNRVVHGASDNIGVMLKDMEDYTIKVNFHANDDFAKQVAELYDGTLRYDTNQYYVELNGNLDDVYDKLLNIQELARDNGMSNDIVSRIGKQTNDVKDLLDQYSQFYSAYVFNERIFGNENYEGIYNNLVKEYQNYRDKLTDADEEGAEKSKAVILQQYYDLYKQLADEDGNLSSENLGIYKALAGLVPELQEELDKNVLKYHLELDTDEVKEESNKIKEALLMFGSEEEILNYKISEEGNGPLDQFYKTIIEYAQAHQIDVQTLIDLYRELYGLEGLSVRNSRGMVNRFQEANGIANYDDKGVRLTNTDYVNAVNALSDEDYETALLFNEEHWKKVNEEMSRIQDSTKENIDAVELYKQAVENVAEEWRKVNDKVEDVADATIVDSVNGINTRLKAQFDSLEKAYQAVFTSSGFDKTGIDNDVLKDIADNFITEAVELGVAEEDAKESAEEFMRVMTDPNVDATKAHDAFNKLATSYFYAAKGLKELNAETANAIKRQMKGMGIVNADEVVDNALKVQEWVDSLLDFDKNLESEYDKLADWGLGDYAEEVEAKTIQTKFGNVDMDKRAIITWSNQLKETYKNELASWNYDPEIGGIDTVFGGSGSFFAGDKEVQVAYTPIIETTQGAELLGKKTVEDYIQHILDAATRDGKWDLQEVLNLDKVGHAENVYDEQGKVIGKKIVKGIIAGIDDLQDISAIDIGELMHFSGEAGAVQLAEKSIEELGDAEEYLKGKGIELDNVTQALVNELLKEGIISAQTAEQLQYYIAAKAAANGTLLNTDSSVQALYNLAQEAGLAAAELEVLNEIMGMFDQATALEEQGAYQAANAVRNEANMRLDNVKRLIQEKFEENMQIDYAPAIKDASKAGSEAADAYVEAYQKEKEKLERDRDMGKKFAHVA